MAPSLLFLFLLLLSSTSSLPPPRKTFLLNSPDRPLLLFTLPDVHNTTTLLLSPDASTLYVGARDALLSLDVSQSDAILLKKRVDWSPSPSEIGNCRTAGKDPEVDCRNFISVLQPLNSTHLYACGSHAFSPRDAIIDSESFSLLQNSDTKAKTRCPHNPLQRSTALTYDGELFTATTTDFKGTKPQISRHFSKDGRHDVCQESSPNLLQEPTFVSSSLDPSNRKLYFFFSEVGAEFSFTDELLIPRVAQVCKDDVGGGRILQKKWTSFAKAPLLCQSPKQLPFNVLQDVFTLHPPEGSNASETLFYGIFTPQWSLAPESAVCVFKLQDIMEVFSGSYRTIDTRTMTWSPRRGNRNLGQCGLEAASDSDLGDVRKSFLTGGKVTPVGNAPVVVSSERRYSRVAAMRARAASGREYPVLFLLTESGFLHKAVQFDGGVQVLEEIQVFAEPQLVKSMVLSSVKGVLYLGTSEGVTAVPVARCSIYRTCSQCVLARDPLCGWSRTGQVCSSLQDRGEELAQDLEDGNVTKACQGQTKVVHTTELPVLLNEAVRLPCQKPSYQSSLTWTSSSSKRLPEELFIRSADGSLRFLASASTFGRYRCEAQEGGYKEVVASFVVRPVAPPRSVNPVPEDEYGDETFGSIFTEEPPSQRSGDSGASTTMELDEAETWVPEESDRSEEESVTHSSTDPTLRKESQSPWREPQDPAPKEKSYYSELVVVSLLLAACVCLLVLGGLHVWRHTKDGKLNPLFLTEDGSKTDQSLESIPSLSSPEHAGPELTVVQ